MYKVESTEWYPRDIETIWLAYTDHERWSEWTSIPKSSMFKEGNEEKNGVGAIRRFGPGGPFDAFEEVLVFEPNKRLEYTVNKGPLPFVNHRGVVVFSEEVSNGQSGTRITWHCTYETRFAIMGKLMEKITQYVFDSSLKGLHNFPFA